MDQTSHSDGTKWQTEKKQLVLICAENKQLRSGNLEKKHGHYVIALAIATLHLVIVNANSDMT